MTFREGWCGEPPEPRNVWWQTSHYTVEERMSATPGDWRPSPTMLDRLGRVTYSSQPDADQAIHELCDLTGDEQERYRIAEIDG